MLVGPFVFKILGDAARNAALAWILVQSGARDLLGYLCIGLPLYAMWGGVVGFGGWSLDDEITDRTIDHIIISRSNLSSILLGKTLGQVIHEVPSGIFSVGIILLIVRQLPEISNIGLYLLSLPIIIFGLSTICVFLSVLVVAVGGKAGFFMGIIAFGAIFNGFIIPLCELPPVLEGIARVFPSAWAMESLWFSINYNNSLSRIIVINWVISLTLSLVWFIVTYYFCQLVEYRIRSNSSIVKW